MLGKLIKHEFKATAKQILPSLLVLLVLSVISRFVIPALENSTSKLGEFIYTIDIILFVASFFALAVAALMALIERFSKSVLGDEGYLTMTLPVSVNEVLFSKLITYFCWMVAISVAVSLALVIAIPFYGNDAPVRLVLSEIRDVFPEIRIWKIIILLAELIIFIFCCFSAFCLHFYSAMAIGNLFSKNRSMFRVLVFIGIMIASFAYWCSCLSGLVSAFTSSSSWMLTGLLFILVSFIQCAALYAVTAFVMVKRFNID